jgi:glutathione synthase/RimK-type ligase-like ATP-grasp enzyme
MILLWGPHADGPLAAVAQALADLKEQFVVIDQQGPQPVLEQQWQPGAEAKLNVGNPLDLADVASAYLRPYEDSPSAGSYATALLAWADNTDALVINRPTAMGIGTSKPAQTGVITDAFQVPPTLVTTDPEQARAFARQHRQVVAKSLSSVRSVVSRLSINDQDALDDVKWCPTQLQAWIDGIDYRVHIIGSDCFACSVQSQADDYRYASRWNESATMTPVQLDEDIASRAIAVTRAAGLVLAGIDLRQDQSGDWWCFEINPSPAFTYYQMQTAQPLAAAIANLLSEPERPGMMHT